MAANKKHKVVFTPELVIELRLNALDKSSKVSIKNAEDTILVLEGVRGLIDEHLVVIYLGKNNVVEGIDAFLTNIKGLDKEKPNRALVRAMINQTTNKEISSVIIVQSLTKVDKPSIKSTNLANLASLAGKMILFEIEVFDCILMGKKGYFSFRRDKKTWANFEKEIKHKKKRKKNIGKTFETKLNYDIQD